MSDRRLVLDWDGTVTESDTLVMVLREFGDPVVFESAAAAVERGEISINEELRRQFAAVTAPLDEVVSWLLPRVRVRAGFAELVERFRPLVITSGFHELVEPVLAREGVRVDVVANRLLPAADGWQVLTHDDRVCSNCGYPCKRSSLPRGSIVYVGDGFSDRCAARAADRVLARDGLARYLSTHGVAFEGFEDFHDVARMVGRM